MIEAMACGTPVLAFRCGSVPEIVDDGVTGMIVETVEQAIAALPHVIALDRQKVRQRFELRFSARRMARDYLEVYRALRAPSKFAAVRPRTAPDHSQNGKDSLVLRPSVA